MAREGARRRSPRDRGSRSVGAIRQQAWRQVTLPYRPVEILSADQIEAIHLASLEILETLGMKVLDAEARRVFRAAGATVDEGQQLVRLDRGLVEEKIALPPSEFTLHARNPGRALRLGGRNTIFSAVGGPAFVADLDRGRRSGTYAEVCDFLRLVQSLNVLHQEGGGPFEALDLQQESRHLDLHYAQLTLMDKNWQPWGLGRARARDGLEMMATALGVSREALVDIPVFTCIINTNSPLMLDIPMAEGLMELAAHGQPVVITPFTLAGAMSPVTLAGALAQQNAEALAGITLTQCVRPGVPVIYGAFTTNVDMRSGAPAFGTPEYTQAAQISGQLARRYKIPFRSSNVTAANDVDAQAAYESEMALWGAIMGHAHLVNHAAGWLGGGLTASFEKLIIDAEILQMMAAYLEPPVVDDATLGLEAIREVGHGGHFFGTPHTLERYETAFYTPLVSDWDNYDNWRDRGSPTAAQRANAIWKQLLAEYQQPPIDPAVDEALKDYVARRKREIAAGVAAPAA
ncbi:MAG: trimethylamine methyltransferase family protein [Kiloniellales bacterium]